MRCYDPLKLRELEEPRRTLDVVFAVACFPKYSRHGVVLFRELMANKNTVKYSCVHCKTMLYLRHALKTFLIIVLCIFLRSRSSLVGIVTGLGTERFGVQILILARYFFRFLKRLGPTQLLFRGLLRWSKAAGA